MLYEGRPYADSPEKLPLFHSLMLAGMEYASSQLH